MPTVSELILQVTVNTPTSILEEQAERLRGFEAPPTIQLDYTVARFFNAFSLTQFFRAVTGTAQSEPVTAEIDYVITQELEAMLTDFEFSCAMGLFDASDSRARGQFEHFTEAFALVSDSIHRAGHILIYRSES